MKYCQKGMIYDAFDESASGPLKEALMFTVHERIKVSVYTHLVARRIIDVGDRQYGGVE